MAKHLWTVLCRRAVIDSATRNTSMFDTLDEVGFTPEEELPDEWINIPLEATFVTFMVRSNKEIPEKPQLKLEIIGPNGQKHPDSHVITADLHSHWRGRTIIQMRAIPFRAFGTHWYVISLGDAGSNLWTEAVRLPLEYKLVKSPQAPAEENQTKTDSPTPVKRAKKRSTKAKP